LLVFETQYLTQKLADSKNQSHCPLAKIN